MRSKPDKAEKALENLFHNIDGLFGFTDPSYVIDLDDTTECKSSSSNSSNDEELDAVERIIKTARISLGMNSPKSKGRNTLDQCERPEDVSSSGVLDDDMIEGTPRKKRRIQLNDSLLSDISASSIGE